MLNYWLKQLRVKLFGASDPAAPRVARPRRKSRPRALLKLECMEHRIVPAGPVSQVTSTEVDVTIPAGETVNFSYQPPMTAFGHSIGKGMFEVAYSGPSGSGTLLVALPAQLGAINVYLANASSSPDALTIGGWGNTPDFGRVSIGANPNSNGSMPAAGTAPSADAYDTVTVDQLYTSNSITVSAGTVNFEEQTNAASVLDASAGTINFQQGSSAAQLIAPTMNLTSTNSLTFQSTGLTYIGALGINAAQPAGQPYAGDPSLTGPNWAAYGYAPGDLIDLFNIAGSDLHLGVIDGIVGDNLYLSPNADYPITSADTGQFSDYSVSVYGYTPQIQSSNVTLNVTGATSTISGAVSLSNAGGSSLNAATDGGNIALQLLAGSNGLPYSLGTLNAHAGTIQLAVDGNSVVNGNTSAQGPNLIAGAVNLATYGTNGSIGASTDPIVTDTTALTTATADGSIFITNEGTGAPLTVASVAAYQQGQAPIVNDDQVVYNSTPGQSMATYSSGSSDVALASAGPVVLNSVSATGTVAVTGQYIVEGNGPSQAVTAQSVQLDANGTANYLGRVTFADGPGGDTLTLPDGQAWTAYGFAAGTAMAGQSIVISGAGDTPNDGAFTIQSVSGSTLTLQQSYALDPEAESNVTVGDGMIGLVSPPNSASPASAPIDLAATNDFSAVTVNGNIELSLGRSVNSTAVSVFAGGTGDVGITSSADFLTIESVIANGARPTGLNSVVGGDVAVAMVSGSLYEYPSDYGTPNQAPGAIYAQGISLSSPLSIGSPSSPFLTDAASALMVSATASSPSEAAIYIDNMNSGLDLASIQVRTDDGTVLIDFNETGIGTDVYAGSLSFTDSELSETGGAVVSFANTDASDGSGDNVVLNSAIDASTITTDGQILTMNSSADVVYGASVVLSAGNGIGTPTAPIDTDVAALDATTTTGNVSISQSQPAAQSVGSGAVADVTTYNGAIVSVSSTPVSGGGGYADNSTVLLEVTGGGGSGAVIEALTNAAGVITAFATTPLTGGGGYAATANGGAAVSTSARFLLLGAFTSNGNIAVNSTGGGDLLLDGVATGVTGTLTLTSDAAVLNTGGSNTNGSTASSNGGNANGGNANRSTISGVTAGTLKLNTSGAIGTAGNPLQTSVATLTVPGGAALFVSNNTSLTVTASKVRGTVSISTIGSLALNSSALGSLTSSVTLTATAGTITDTSAITADTLTLAAENVGSSATALQTNSSVINATADYGGVYINNSTVGFSTTSLTLTAAAVGPTNNINVRSSGGIALLPLDSSLPGAGSTPVAIYNPGGTATLTAGSGATVTSAFTAADLITGLGTHTAVLSAGMAVSGPGIPANDTVALVNPTGSNTDGEIELTEPATATATGASLTFGTAPNAISFKGNTTGSPGYIVCGLGTHTAALSAGMAVSGPGIPANDTVALVNPTGSSGDGEIELTEPATATATGASLTFGTAPNTSSFAGNTTGTAGTYYDVYTGTLKIGNATITSSGSLAGAGYGPLVTQTNTAEIAVFAPLALTNSGPLVLSAGALASGGTFVGSTITIDELGSAPLAINGNLTLEATGAIVFLDSSNALVSNGSITVTAGGVAALGNLATDGGNVTIAAAGNVGVGTIDAGTGTVSITSPGSVFDNNGGSLTITAGKTLLYQAKAQVVAQGNSPSTATGSDSLAQLQLDATEAIAAASAAGAQAAADQTTANAFLAELNSLQTSVANDQTAYQNDVAATNSAQNAYDSLSNKINAENEAVNGLNEVQAGLNVAAAVSGFVADFYLVDAGVVEALPGAGPELAAPPTVQSGTIHAIADSLNLAAAVTGLTVASLEYQVTADENTLGNDQTALAAAQSAQTQADAQLLADQDTETAVAAAYNVAQQGAASEAISAQQDQAIAQADSALVLAASALSSALTSASATAATATAQPLSVTGPLTVTGEAPQSGSGTTGLAISAPITVNTATGVTAPAGVTLNGNGNSLTVSANVTAPGPIALSAPASAAGGGELSVSSGATIQSNAAITLSATGNQGSGATVVLDGTLAAPTATIYAGSAGAPDSSNDTFTVTPSANTPITVDGGTGQDTLNFEAGGLPVTVSGDAITAGTLAPVTFSNIKTVNIIDAASVLTFEGTSGMTNTLSVVGTGQEAATATLNGVAYSFTGVTDFIYQGSSSDKVAVTPYVNANIPWDLTVNTPGGTSAPASVKYSAPGSVSHVAAPGSTAGSVAEPGGSTGNDAPVNPVTQTAATAPSATAGAPINGGPVVVTGAGSGDTLVITASDADSGSYSLDGGAPVPFSGITSFTFDGLGNDTLVVNNPPGGAFDPVGGTHYDGGAGANTLTDNVNGSTVGTVPGGLATGGATALTYTHVTTIDLNAAAAVEAQPGPDTVDRAAAFSGLTAQERYVQALYLADLGRAGSTSELDAWAALLPASGGSAVVANGIAGSFEAQDRLVKEWYLTYLGRAAQGGEEQPWVNQLQRGASEETVLSGILGTAEFYARAQSLVATGTADQRFAEALYQVLLNRAGDAPGVLAWVTNMGTRGRQGVAAAFLASQEFRADQFEGDYDALLHRPADPSGLNALVTSALGIGSARAAIESSSEFFNNG
jgi:hypothetical protein